jgi:hypothetical protein
MSISSVNKNTGATVVNATSAGSTGGGMDFNSQLAELKRINEEATLRSIELRKTYTELNSKKKVADERVQ